MATQAQKMQPPAAPDKKSDCNLLLPKLSGVSVNESALVFKKFIGPDSSLVGPSDVVAPVAVAETPLPTSTELEKLKIELQALMKSTQDNAAIISQEFEKAETFIKTEAKRQADMPPPIQVGSEVVVYGQGTADAPQSASSNAPSLKLKLKAQLFDNAAALDTKQKKKAKNRTNDDGIPKRGRDDDSSSVMSGGGNFKKSRHDVHGDVKNGPVQGHPVIPGAEDAAQNAENIRIKPSNQVSSITFWNYVDQVFKPITEDDLKVLDQNDVSFIFRCTKPFQDDPTPFIIPPLGKHYRQVWLEEDQSLFPQNHPENSHASKLTATSEKKSKKKSIVPQLPQNEVENTFLDDQNAVIKSYSGGPISERLVSALIEDKESVSTTGNPDIPDMVSEADDMESVSYKEPNREEVYSIEQRLKRELKFIGLLDSDPEDEVLNEKEDEISLEIRQLQSDLRRLMAVNKERKRIVREKAVERLAYQEYGLILNELEKQIEQMFAKRQKIYSKKRKRTTSTVNGQHTNSAEPFAPTKVHLPVLARRKRMIQDFEPVFPEAKLRMPTESVFKDDAVEWIASLSKSFNLPSKKS
ncbi:hypothetical protein MP638_003977 [Amoeboaphelidium occidentale]|nr:hypothetical protein MP638_003977 [Amoeboaphelidium occidentale]